MRESCPPASASSCSSPSPSRRRPRSSCSTSRPPTSTSATRSTSCSCWPISTSVTGGRSWPCSTTSRSPPTSSPAWRSCRADGSSPTVLLRRPSMPVTSGVSLVSTRRWSGCRSERPDAMDRSHRTARVETGPDPATAAAVRPTMGPLRAAVRQTRAAIRLLTRLPLGSTAVSDADASGAVAFPIVGAFVGLIGLVPLAVAGSTAPLLAAFLALAAVAVVTGALHLDGLADTADALLAPDADRAERARKDPSTGPGGVGALILVLGLEAAALSVAAETGGGWIAGAALVVAAVAGRTMAVVATVTERSTVAPDGFGAWFAARVRPRDAVVAGVIATVLAGVAALAVSSAAIAAGGLTGAATGFLLAHVIAGRRGRLDGDGLGAIVELAQTAV